jgi:hypothetical protein
MCVFDELHIIVNCAKNIECVNNNASITNTLHGQQCKLYVSVTKINYIPTNLQSFHALHTNAEMKQKNIHTVHSPTDAHLLEL